MDTTCSKVRKSALRIVINHGCQKHFWRTISAGRVLGVKGRRVLILYLSLFWCYSKPPTHLIHIWAQTPPLVTLSTSWHIFYLIKSTTHNYKMNQHKPFIPHLSPSLTGPSFSDFPSGLPVPARRLQSPDQESLKNVQNLFSQQMFLQKFPIFRANLSLFPC